MIGPEEEADHVTDNGAPVYRRVLLKLSGEALMGDLEYGTDPDRVQAIATEVAKVPGATVVPDPPQTLLMHIHLATSVEAVTAGLRRLANEEHVWFVGGTAPTDTPGIRRVELSVGESTLTFSPAEVARIIGFLLPAVSSS